MPRTSRLRLGIVFATSLVLCRPAVAEPLPSPIDDFGRNTLSAFGGTSWIYGLAAVATTAGLAATGGDHAIRLSIQENIDAPAWGDAAVYGGYVIPIVAAPGVYLTGLLADDSPLAGAGSAATQALVVTFVTTVVLKVASGRPFPLHGGDPNAPDRLEHPEYAREFHPFGFAGNYAWPSGHAAAAFSVAAALTSHRREHLVVPLVAYPLALGITGGMLVGDHHWTSDVLAGALVGQALGWSFGDSFRASNEASDDAASPHVSLVPLLSGVRGCAVVWTM